METLHNNQPANQPTDTTPRVFHCNDCGGVIYKHEIFCSNCGKKLDHYDFED